MLHRQGSRIFRQIRASSQNYYSSEVNSVPLTADRYPNIKRGNYANLEENDVKIFETILGKNRVLTQEDELNGDILLFKKNLLFKIM